MPAHRSFLFAPGNHARKVAKVFGCGADDVILDLEEAVARAERVATRALVIEAEREGSSSIQLDGYFIDYPIVYKAQRTLDAAGVGSGGTR